MKIDELKRIAKENDYKLENKHNQLEHKLEFRRNTGGLEDILNQIAIREGIENRIFFNINYCNEKDLNMIKASIEYAETPLEDREEEKKFYLKHRWMDGENEANYLNFVISGFYYTLNTKPEASWAKTKFTINEIEDIKKKLGTDLDDFELVEVEE